MKILEPSLLAFNPDQIPYELERMKAAGAHIIHYDVMDGKFVNNTTPYETKYLKLISKLNLKSDVHLMVNDVRQAIHTFLKHPVYALSFHVEACSDNASIIENLNLIKANHVLAGVAINPNTNAKKYKEVFAQCDFVNIMSVMPGYAGQKFLTKSMPNIKYIKKQLKKHPHKMYCVLDGGVNAEVIKKTKKYINRYVSGSFLLKCPDPHALFVQIRQTS
ncbi:MAG: ribulose-phosphate 3-epimerase [Mycoplasmataceae bacterium]|jgi:ribulose-phosphate 3-epimerase|nr:ribulose-phosphate 3-epimerase [Mycoplasmataceae bacterium]